MPQSVLRIAEGALQWLRKARMDDNSQRAKGLSELGRTLLDADGTLSHEEAPRKSIERI
jgi:hypothetical protein